MQDTIIQINERKTFPIFHQWKENGLANLEIRGTGFFIKNGGYFLTAHHVMSDTHNTSKFLYGGNIPHSKHQFKIIQEIISDSKRDIYLGRVIDYSQDYCNIRKSKMSINESTNIIGYPDSKVEFDNKGHVVLANLKQTIINSKINNYYPPLNYKSRYNYTGYFFHNDIKQGISGSPCFDNNGDVFGIAVASFVISPVPETSLPRIHYLPMLGVAIDILTVRDIINTT